MKLGKKFWNKVIITLLRSVGRKKADYPKGMYIDQRDSFIKKVKDVNKRQGKS